MDARRFVEDYTGEPFDYVIDDVFCEDDDGEPIRAIAFDDDWYGKVCLYYDRRRRVGCKLWR